MKEQDESVDNFIGRMDEMKFDLGSIDIEIAEDIFLAKIIGGLPSEFGNVTESWEMIDSKQNLVVKKRTSSDRLLSQARSLLY